MIDLISFAQTPRTWLITGVAGFIGSNLLEMLLNLNQTVIGVDNFYTGFQSNIDQVLRHLSPEKRRRFTFHKGDICSLNTCHHIMTGVDIVLHQAALSSVPKSIEYVEMTHDINVNGFFNILVAARAANVKRVVYASSCAVYGNLNPLPNCETQPVDILSPYNATKYMNELYADMFSTCYGMECIGLRYFNIYGPRQDAHSPYAAVITRWLDALLHQEQTYIHDDHHQSRDFCYIDDVVMANLLAATTNHPQAVNTVYNIATGEEVDLHDVHDLLVSALNIPPVQPISQKSSPGELDHSRGDISKARRLLGYAPTYTLRDGIHQLVASAQKTARTEDHALLED